MTFSYHVMFIHNNHGYLQEERILHLKNHSEFVLIIFYPQLINSSMLIVLWQTKTTVIFPLEDKYIVNEHHVIQKIHDATLEKCPHMVHFSDYLRN